MNNYNEVHVTFVSSTNPQFNYPGVDGKLRYSTTRNLIAEFWPDEPTLLHEPFHTSRVQEVKEIIANNGQHLITLQTLNSIYVFCLKGFEVPTSDTSISNILDDLII